MKKDGCLRRWYGGLGYDVCGQAEVGGECAAFEGEFSGGWLRFWGWRREEGAGSRLCGWKSFHFFS